MKDDVNLCAHAMEYVRDYRKRMENAAINGLPANKEVARCLATAAKATEILLDKAIKFRVPDKGIILDWEGCNLMEQLRKYCQPFRLPYPVIALEFTFDNDDAPGGDAMHMTRDGGIAIAYEVMMDDQVCIMIHGITRFKGDPPQIMMGGRPIKWGLGDYTVCLFADGTMTGTCIAAAAGGKIAPELNTLQMAAEDMQAEIAMVCQLMAALKCKNVSSVEIKPSIEANQLRRARGKQPFYSYHMLEIGGQATQQTPAAGGTHSSPRIHLRRGHIRQHPTAGSVWVNACVVGNKELGMVAKDYRVVTEQRVH